MLERFRAVTSQRRKVLASLSDDEWNAPTTTPSGPDSYGRFMRIRIFDCWMHEQDIRAAVQRPSSDDELGGPASPLVLVDEQRAHHGVRRRQAGQSARRLPRAVGADRPAVSQHPRFRGRSSAGGRRLRWAGADGDDPPGRTAVHQARRRAPDEPGAQPGCGTRRRQGAGRSHPRAPELRDLTGKLMALPVVESGVRIDGPAEGRQGCEGLNGFDFAHRIKGSVPVQARDHRKRRCDQISADSHQRDYALAA
ncbi:hypothetical protein MRGA423_19330 [Mycobacterium tuberculosis RGTB423]|nr:hypothetical protein MRGA423_19330 [Mycobacterium tuberculosis RGTB423]